MRSLNNIARLCISIILFQLQFLRIHSIYAQHFLLECESLLLDLCVFLVIAYLISHVTCLNNTHEQFYKLSHDELDKISLNQFGSKLYPLNNYIDDFMNCSKLCSLRLRNTNKYLIMNCNSNFFSIKVYLSIIHQFTHTNSL